MTIAEQMIQELTHEAGMTRRLIARIPADTFGFSPGHGLRTVEWNARHLADIVGWVPWTVNESGLDLARFDTEQDAAFARMTDVPAVLRQFDENLARSLASLEGVSDARLAEPWSMRAGEQVLWTMTKRESLRKWVFTHSAHHRGVLSTMLRLAGVEHGSIYEE